MVAFESDTGRGAWERNWDLDPRPRKLKSGFAHRSIQADGCRHFDAESRDLLIGYVIVDATV